jgi:hypothetical protein
LGDAGVGGLVVVRRHPKGFARGWCWLPAALAGACALGAPSATTPAGLDAPGEGSAFVYTATELPAEPPARGVEAERAELVAAMCMAQGARPVESRRPAREAGSGYGDPEWDQPEAGARNDVQPLRMAGPSVASVWRQTSGTEVRAEPQPFDKVMVVPSLAEQTPASPLPTNLYLRDAGWGSPTFGESRW